jgi:hypothetical protein
MKDMEAPESKEEDVTVTPSLTTRSTTPEGLSLSAHHRQGSSSTNLSVPLVDPHPNMQPILRRRSGASMSEASGGGPGAADARAVRDILAGKEDMDVESRLEVLEWLVKYMVSGWSSLLWVHDSRMQHLVSQRASSAANDDSVHGYYRPWLSRVVG